jgi:quinol monooxygenase YgiN
MNLTIEIRANPEKFQELYQSLQTLLPTMRKRDGCRESRLYRDVDEGEIFFLSMHWEDSSKFEGYMQSVSGSALLGAIDLLSKSVRVKMGSKEPWGGGIEILKRIRKGT